MHKSMIVLVSVFVLAFAPLALPTVGFADPPGFAGPPESNTMRYGEPGVGSGCNFPCDDDASFHTVDKIRPGAIHIQAGETVQFEVNGFHQVAIYDVGTSQKDIEPDEDEFPFVEDVVGRIFLDTVTLNEQFTFNNPGKYFVICNVAPHFENAQMWGWVIVQ